VRLCSFASLFLGFGLGFVLFHPHPVALLRRMKAQVALAGGEEAAPGHWGFMRPGVGLEVTHPDQRAEIKRLQSLGYVGGSVPAMGATGTTVHCADLTWPGLRFYASGHAPEASLIDPAGHVLHTWNFSYDDFRRLMPDSTRARLPHDPDMTACWRRAHLFPDGRVLAIFEGHGLVCLDRTGRFLWGYPGPCHHDLAVAPDTTLYVLTRNAQVLPRFHPDKPVLLDYITHLDCQGRVLDTLDLLSAFESSIYASCLDAAKASGDIFHTNTLEILDGTHAHRSPAFAAGNFLISVRELGVVAVVDPKQGTVVWALSGLWSAQHQPTLLPSGNLLVFDNQGHGGQSKVVEIDPLTQQVAWEYTDSQDHPFFSRTCGSCQRLDNGNTLITESDNGRAFETAPDGTVVWEYRNPRRTGPEGVFIAAIMEMVALPVDFRPEWLKQAVPPN